MIFTNSADQLRASLDRRVDKEMALEALRQTNARDAMTREEHTDSNRATNTQQAFDRGPLTNSTEDRTQDDRPVAEEFELEFNS